LVIECSNCHSRYQYDEAKFEGKPSKKIKCARCQHIFQINNPAVAVAPAAQSVEAAEVGERTSIRRERPRTLVDELLPDIPPPPPPTPAPVPTSGAAPLAMPSGKRLSLAVIDGPDAGTVFRLEKPRVTIGRQGSDINLNDADASRQHAALEIRESVYTLVDLGSTNGTLMDAQKIDKTAELQNHSEFQVGSSTLMLIVTEEL
jgi:predicted Zn finger-like uncharacterized protein